MVTYPPTPPDGDDSVVAAVRRHQQRLSSAALRAVAAEPLAELRGTRLEVADRPVGIVVPHLALSIDDLDTADRRGVVDGMAVRVRFSDRRLHLDLSPTDPLERIVFDVAEQFRCEAQTDLPGAKANMARSFGRWTELAMAEGMTDSGVGLLIFTITHMLRYRLTGMSVRHTLAPAVDEVIETTRGNLSRLVGYALKPLPELVPDQVAFAEPAAEIARLVAEMAGDADVRQQQESTRHRFLVPVDWDTLEQEVAGSSEALVAETGRTYSVYTSQFDSQITGHRLYPVAVQRRLRRRLEELEQAQAVSPARVAQRLRPLLVDWDDSGWIGSQEDGVIDSRRLAALIADPANRSVHRAPERRASLDAVVTFLIDNSGSMKVQRYESMTVLVDTMARAIDLAGARSEVLGFTTSTWSGGGSRQQWTQQGQPENPGRLADRQHIVYKSADETWRQARLSIAALLKTDHYREGLDGEAVEWAVGRLASRPEKRRLLVLVSDGLPMETSTTSVNRDGYLVDHLRQVWESQATARNGVRLAAITLDHDLSAYLLPSVRLDLTGTLTIGTYEVLRRLFGSGSTAL